MTLDIKALKRDCTEHRTLRWSSGLVHELITRLEVAEKDATQYQELIYAVGHKFPNETRHETALKYIHQMEGGAA